MRNSKTKTIVEALRQLDCKEGILVGTLIEYLQMENNYSIEEIGYILDLLEKLKVVYYVDQHHIKLKL